MSKNFSLWGLPGPLINSSFLPFIRKTFLSLFKVRLRNLLILLTFKSQSLKDHGFFKSSKLKLLTSYSHLLIVLMIILSSELPNGLPRLRRSAAPPLLPGDHGFSPGYHGVHQELFKGTVTSWLLDVHIDPWSRHVKI